MKVGVVGYKGRMGSLVYEALRDVGKETVGVDINDSLFDVKDCDLVVDFSLSNNSCRVATFCCDHKIPLIICSTGQTEREIDHIQSCSKHIPIMLLPNASVGMSALLRSLKSFKDMENIEASIVEYHHKKKKDNPSGTAKLIERLLLSYGIKVNQNIGIRQGEIIGKHNILLSNKYESIEITHIVNNRRAFAQGVVEIVDNFVKLSPKFYCLPDCAEEIYEKT